jgi:hypothetical protein
MVITNKYAGCWTIEYTFHLSMQPAGSIPPPLSSNPQYIQTSDFCVDQPQPVFPALTNVAFTPSGNKISVTADENNPGVIGTYTFLVASPRCGGKVSCDTVHRKRARRVTRRR